MATRKRRMSRQKRRGGFVVANMTKNTSKNRKKAKGSYKKSR